MWVTGPLVEIVLQGHGAASRETLEGIVDTGASVICLDRRVAVRLDLTPINIKTMVVADGSEVQATVYMAQMTIPELEFRDWVEVHGLPMKRATSRVLIGRSFLSGYHVTYNGPEDRFYYARPPSVLLMEAEHDG